MLAWGALNAIAPTKSRPQLAFKLDYAGGWGKYHTNYWKTFKNSCGAYTGPKLAWYVTGCTAADGSFWALQAWQRMLPNYGVAASPHVGKRVILLDRSLVAPAWVDSAGGDDKITLKFCSHSSIGQSVGLRSRRLQVRLLLGTLLISLTGQ